jgi:hypothetical protein
MHGSIGSIETLVFKSDDYQVLAEDLAFKDCLKYLLSACSLVFIGYSIRDRYVLNLLNQNAAAHSLFGDGPHFLVSPAPRPELPKCVTHSVRY